MDAALPSGVISEDAALPSGVPTRRITTKSTLKALRPLSQPEREAEEMAEANMARLQSRSGVEVVRVLGKGETVVFKIKYQETFVKNNVVDHGNVFSRRCVWPS